MNDRPTNSHSLFFVVLFMSALVVGTVVAYFVFLPSVAPKVIVLSVFPFTTNEGVPDYFSQGFPTDLRNGLALSRDVLVIDFQSSSQPTRIKDDLGIFLKEMDSTHFVDGHVQLNDRGELLVTPRLVNVSQPMWKGIWKQEYVTNLENLQLLRNELVQTIRSELYDYSSLRVPAVEGNSASYVAYLSALQATLNGDQILALRELQSSISRHDNSASRVLLSKLDSTLRKGTHLIRGVELNGDNPDARALDIRAQIGESGLRDEDLSELEWLANNFPNSVAVRLLADIYVSLGWFTEAELLLSRWARLHPKSVDPAIEIAVLRFRKGDVAGVEEALSISDARLPGNETTKYWRNFLDLSTGRELASNSAASLYRIQMAMRGDLEMRNTVIESISNSSDCDRQIEVLLFLAEYERALDALTCAVEFWTKPPPFWREDDRRWQAYIQDRRFVRHVRRLGFDEILESGRKPVSVQDMFKPRRS